MVLRLLQKEFWVLGMVVTVALPGCSVFVRSHPNALFPAKSITPVQMEAEVHQRINQIRQENGLPPLQRNETLTQVARNYSEQMGIQNFFDHKDPSGKEAVQRVYNAGLLFQLVGENLYRNVNAPDPVEDAIQGWMASPGHRENILRPVFTQTGIGVWCKRERCYFTQLFIQP